MNTGRIGVVYRVFGPYLRPYRGRIAAAYAAMGAAIGFSLLRPWPLKLILDSVLLRNKTIHDTLHVFVPPGVDALDASVLVTILASALVAIVVAESVAAYFQKVLFAEVGHRATTDVLEQVYSHVQTLPRSGGKTRTGDVIVRLTSDVKTMRDLLVEHVQKLGTYSLTFLGTVAVTASMNWRLTLLGLVIVPVIYLASVYFSGRIRRAARDKRSREGEVANAVQETLHSILVIQAFTQEHEERRRFRKRARRSLEANVESSRLGGVFNRSITVLNTVGTALVVWFGAHRVLEGSMTPGDLVVFASYMNELYKPVQSFSELSVQFAESLISGERVLEVLETSPRVADAPGAVAPPPLRGEIELRDVVFGYHRDEDPVLRGLSVRIEPGKKVALVGRSGSGKSTLLQLLLRFHDPWSGAVCIDGQDIRRFQVRGLRDQISVVLQESVLFRRTVRENIAYGRPGASEEAVIAAARAAQAHDFIVQLPRGYDTMLDEAGSNLSGGQRQRIALARAFLRDAPLLLMDEPTSGLDARTEAAFTETLRELTRGRTTVMIAHRLSTVEDADQILVLEGGRVAEQGTHDELLARRGLYWELYEGQRAAAGVEPPA